MPKALPPSVTVTVPQRPPSGSRAVADVVRGPRGMKAFLVPIEHIEPDPDQPRTDFPDEGLRDLAMSIGEHGVLQPLLVREDGIRPDGHTRYRIIAGGRRHKAALMIHEDNHAPTEHKAHVDRLPVFVRDAIDADDPELRVLQLIENLQREDLNVVDRAAALKQLKVNLGTPNGKSATWEEVAATVGVSKRRVLQLADVADLDEAPQEALRTGALTEKHTRGMKGMTPAQQADLTAATVAHELTPDEATATAREMKRDPAVDATHAIARATAAKTPRTPAVRPAGPLAGDAPISRGDATATPTRPPIGHDLPEASLPALRVYSAFQAWQADLDSVLPRLSPKEAQELRGLLHAEVERLLGFLAEGWDM